MKNYLLVVLISGLIFLSGCHKDDPYDKGYEAAWEEEDEPGFWASQEEKDGYEDGCDDFENYQSGYYDGAHENEPEDLDNDCYMDGYKDGKEDW